MGSMDGEISIQVADGGRNPTAEEVKRDERGPFNEVSEDEMNSSKEEEIWRSRQQKMNKALADSRPMSGQDPAEVYAAAGELARVVKQGDVDEFLSKIESFAGRIDPLAVLNTRREWNLSLLHSAAINRKDDILRLLIDSVGVHLIASQDDWGDTPLHSVAISGGSTRAAEMLIRRARDLPNVDVKNRNLRMKNELGNTALHEAVINRLTGVVDYLLREDSEPVYWKNKAQKSPLYLAANTNVSKMHEALFLLSLEPSRIQGLPPIHGAIAFSNYDLVALILKKNMKLFAMTDSKGGNVFHTAAFLNQAWVFEFLQPETKYLVREWDMNGDLPIHIASKMGYVKLIKKLKKVSWRLNTQGQTILHVAAKYGRASVVRYILRDPELSWKLNRRDYAGNTALHLAAMHSQPTVLIHLVRSEGIEARICNNECLTALDIARERMAMGYTSRKQLALLALACSFAGKVSPVSRELPIVRPEDRDKEFSSLVRSRGNKPDSDMVKDYIKCRLLVAMLVATVIFGAGFAVPGGFNGSYKASKNENHRGMAMMLHKRMFPAFTICNAIAMFCSMTVVVNLIWARLVDVKVKVTAFERTTLPLKIALLAMSTTFLTGVTLTAGRLPWLAYTIVSLGLPFLLIISGAILLEHPPVFITIHSCPIRRLTLWLILAYNYLWRVETYVYDDTEDDRGANETFASRPADGAGELKTDDSATAKCEDAPHSSNH